MPVTCDSFSLGSDQGTATPGFCTGFHKGVFFPVEVALFLHKGLKILLSVSTVTWVAEEQICL